MYMDLSCHDEFKYMLKNFFWSFVDKVTLDLIKVIYVVNIPNITVKYLNGPDCTY